MRSYIRLFGVFAAILLLCTTLSGCTALDNARAAQGHWRNDSILLNGALYEPLPENPYVYPEFNEFENYVHITADEVPVLLSFIGELYYISDDQLFLEGNETGNLYCRADVCGDILDKLTNGFEAEAYCYWSYGSEGENVYTLTDDETLAVSAVMAATEPTVMPAGVSLDYTHWATVFACTADRLLREYVYDVIEMDGTYYVTYLGEIETYLYKVPAEYAAAFRHILEAQRTADESWDAWYDDEWESDYDL